MRRQSIRIAGFFSASVLAACSGGFERGSSERTGVFVDSPVSGLDYRTATRSAKTSTAGVFTYSDGELVSFNIGSLQLGSVNGAGALTPMNLVPGATSVSNNRVSNMAVLLQSLDRNLDVRDGLDIPAAAAEKISGFAIDLNKTSNDFSSDGQVLAFVRAANNDNRNLVTPAQAQANLQRTQDEMAGNGATNRLPVANAGDDRTVDEGAAVSITGQGSDADGRIVSYQWSRVSGPMVTLNDATTATVRFTAPQVSQQSLLTLRLTVTDDQQGIASDDVVITIRDISNNSNTPPVANAGADQTVTEGASVTLDGRASTDAQDGNNLGYAWTQTAGPNVTLNAANSSQPNFTAPQVSAQTTLGFRLTVSDTQQARSTDEVQVIVNDSTTPPPPAPAFDLCDPVMHTYCLSQVPTLGPALLGVLQPILGGSTPAASSLWLKGDLHVHDDHSADGSFPRQTIGQGSPGNTSVADQIFWAETMGLDFLPLTDHRTFDQHYDPQWKSSKLILITGEEANSSPHAIVLGAVDMINQADNPSATLAAQSFRKLQQSIWDAHLQGAAWSTAHPDDGEVQTVNADGSITPNNNAFATGPNLVEIWNRGTLNRPKIAYCEDRWNAGYRFGIAGASDNHFKELWPIAGPGQPVTQVLAQQKSAQALIEALRAGHTSIHLNAAAPFVTLSGDFDNNGVFEAVGGDEIKLAPGGSAKLRVSITNGIGATVRVYRMPGISAGAFKEFQPTQPQQNFDFDISGDATKPQDWYRVEVRGPGDPDGLDYSKFLKGDPQGSLDPDYANQLRAVTAPIFVYGSSPAQPLSPQLPADAGATDAAQVLMGSDRDNAFAGFADVAESAGVVHAVAEVQGDAASRVIYRRLSGGVLSAPIDLAAASRAAHQPKIVAAGSQVWVVWQDGRFGETPHRRQIMLRHSSDGGQTWEPEQQVSTSSARAEHPDIALISPSLPVVVWQDNSGGAFDVLARVVGRDAVPINLSASGKTVSAGNGYDTRSARYPASVHPRVTVRSSDGLIAVGWEDNRNDVDAGWSGHATQNPQDQEGTQTDDWEILLATRAASAAQWSAPGNVSQSAQKADRHVALAFDRGGLLHAAWDSKTLQQAGPRLAIMTRRSLSAATVTLWAPLEAIAAAPEFSSQRPAFGRNGDALNLLWMDGRSADWRWRVMRSVLNAEAVWGAAQTVTGRGNAAWPSYANGWLVFTSDRNATREQRKPHQVFLNKLDEPVTITPINADAAGTTGNGSSTDICDPIMHTYCLSQVPVIGPALLGALGGSASSNPLPDRLPVLSEPTPRGNLTVTPLADKSPTTKIVDGDIADWVGGASRIGGTARYDAGEYIYSDYLFDAYGADDGTDKQRLDVLDPLAAQASRTFRLDQLFQAAGDQFGAPPPAGALDRYGDTTSLNDQADLSEVRWAASGNQTYFLARTTTLTDPSKLAILILIDAVPGPASSKPVGFGTTLQTGLFDTAVLLTSAGVQAKDLATGAVVNLSNAQVKINAAGWTNAVEAALPATLFGNGVARVAVIAGPRKADGLTPANVAYRFHEPVAGVYNDKQQALALLAGNIDQFRAEISLDALRRGASETAKPAPGYHERQFISGENISREEGEDGLLQRYGLYIPKLPALNLQGQTPLTLWMHYRGGKAHSGAAWTPRLITQLGEEQGNIVATPHGRGTSTWYTTQSHQDFFEVFADLAGTAIAGQENLETPKEISALLNVDADRVYLSGYSMGGYATYLFGLLYPDKFAAGFAQSGAVTQGAWTGVGPDDANCTSAPQNIPGLDENGNVCFIEANSGMANAQLKYRILENARHLPIEINHGSNDELALTPGAERMGLRLAELNYRYDMMTFIGYEHYTQAIMDEWADGAAYINRFRRNANPRQVTYKIVPAMVRAVNTVQERGKGPFHFNPNSAYWVRDLVVRNPDFNNPTKFGMIDAVSDAISEPVIVPMPRTGDVNPTAKSGPQASTPVYSPGYHSTPYVRHGLDWQETPLSTSVLNRFSATLTGLSAASFDVSRMKLDVTRRLDGVVKSDGATTLSLLNVTQPVRVFVNQIERADAYRDGKIVLPLTASDFSTGQALIQIQPQTNTLAIDATATTGIVPLCRSLGAQVQPLCDGIESGTNQLIAGCVNQFGQSPAFCATLGGHLQGIVAACRANNGSVLCKTADTFLEGMASNCRQIPQAPRDFCALLSSQRIAADEITQFEKTWTYRALQLQYELGAPLRFVDALFPATHNSFNAADANTPPTLSGLDSNQRYGTVDQLRMGIRAIEIDVHWMPRADKMGFAPTVCHGNQEHVGCTLERSLEAELTDVRKWMDANPTQVILIYLENNLNQPTDAPTGMLTGAEPYAAAATVIRNTLGTLLYTPADHAAFLGTPFTCSSGHPLKAGIQSLRASAKRVYIQTEGCDAGWASLVFNKEAASSHTQSPDTSQLQTFSVDGVCGGFSRADHQKKWTRYFEDGTLVGAVTSQSDTHLGSPEDFRGMVRCGVNMPSMDHVTPSDPRLPAFVWSWEPGQPSVSTTQNCALHTQGARFRAADCTTLKPYACVRYSDIVGAPAQKSEWAIGLPAGAGSVGVCPTGYQFAAPRNGYENELLRIAKLAANVNEVWLNYSDAAMEGAWRMGSTPAP